jgi:hypothetical protein
LPDLIVQFDCNNAETWAEEFQHHLVSLKTIPAPVQAETHENELWLVYPNITPDAIKRITREAHPWCLDRGLGLLEGSGEDPQTVKLMIADLAKVME